MLSDSLKIIQQFVVQWDYRTVPCLCSLHNLIENVLSVTLTMKLRKVKWRALMQHTHMCTCTEMCVYVCAHVNTTAMLPSLEWDGYNHERELIGERNNLPRMPEKKLAPLLKLLSSVTKTSMFFKIGAEQLGFISFYFF